MPYGQAKELVDFTRVFHKKVSNIYQQIADQGQSERVKLLLDYMIRHEKHLEQAIKDYEQSVSSKALNAWYQFAIENRSFAPLESIKYSADMTVDQIMEIGATLDNCLINSYKGIADSATLPAAREIFENLLAMEEQQKHVKARIALGINDM